MSTQQRRSGKSRGKAVLGAATLALSLTTAITPASAAAPPPSAPIPPADQLLGNLPPLPLAHPASAYAWYTPPSPLPAGKPGDVIKKREILVNPTVPDAARTTQFMYLSTNEAGERVPVTATLLSPAGPNGKLIALSHGTMGLGRQCAPSEGFNAETIDPRNPDYEILTYQQYLLRGDSVVITDYLGAGTPLPQEYLVGKSEAYNDLDAARAAESFGPGLGPSSPVGLSGYSQGGQAAAWADQIAPSYAPELDIRGAIIDAPPVDMVAQYNQVNGNPTAGSGFALAAIQGVENAFHNLDLAHRTTAFGERAFARSKASCVVEDIATFGTITDAMVTNPTVGQDAAFIADLRKSQLGTIAPSVPSYIYQGSLDTIVPPNFGPQLYQSWCGMPGTTVRFTQLPAQEHLSGNVTGTPQAIAWMQDRLDGKPIASGCATGHEAPGL